VERSERPQAEAGTSSRHGLFLLVMVNALNAADAILTDLSIRWGLATELNPVASLLGTWGKLALVAVASYLLYRIRPQALIWPTLALAAVVGYIVIGMALTVAGPGA
jgi:hypothetical protein